VLGGDLDLASGNPEQRLAVDYEPCHAADATRSQIQFVSSGIIPARSRMPSVWRPR
jgi:hypothetical protein